MSIDLQKTHAIVVGVETYAAGSNWNLDGPANDACKFVKWLLAKGVHAEQISLFVSPLPENQALLDSLDLKPRTADYGTITKALIDDLSKKTGDLLIFFWGGHGVVDSKHSRRLFCADATSSTPRHISLNSLLTSWRTDTIGHFPKQIGFVDACQNYLEYMRLASTMPEDVLPSGTPVDGVEQFFMLAASPGELAANLLHEKTGAFSKALMEELEKQETSWPPEMSRLNSQLMERFTMLRDAGKAGQTPSHYWYREWNGSEGTIGSFKRHSPAKAVAQIQLSNEDRDELVLALLELDVMSNREERQSVITDLRREIKHNIPDNPKARFHVDNTVRTALNYPGGIQELIHVVGRFKGADEKAWQNLSTILSKHGIQS